MKMYVGVGGGNKNKFILAVVYLNYSVIIIDLPDLD